MVFSPEQEKVIYLRNKNILVSAAAGSGKTSVLVERIMKRITDPKNPVDIDRILTVTFTNAAAAEMKDRIRKGLRNALKAEPENSRLKEQLNLLHNASIMTIDSFCVKVIRENFEELSIDPAFRVGDENEMEMIREDACDEILNESYEEGNPEFLTFLDLCSPGREDRDIAENIMKLSKNADTRENPEEWLISLKEPYIKAESDEKLWSGPVMQVSDMMLRNTLLNYQKIIDLSQSTPGPYMYLPLLEDERKMAENILSCKSYEERYKAMQCLSFGRLPSKKDEEVDVSLRETVKNIRGNEKDRLNKMKDNLFSKDRDRVVSELKTAAPAVRKLIDLTLKYRERTAEMKEKKGVLDFSDIEHMALQILRKDAGDVYRELYTEVMTDEYQDTNGIQEALLTRVAGNNNYFCVGDVKQSIYGFRLSEPGIFLGRFKSYEEDPLSERILLNKNYRSRSSVIDFVNALFTAIMHEETGGIEYDEKQKLFYGNTYDKDDIRNKTEIRLIEKGEDEEAEKIELEAAFIADRIISLKNSLQVEGRKALYSDFAVLLRSASGTDEKIRDILRSRGIPAVTEKTKGYFKTREVRDVLNYLTIIDNPRQDIPLIALLKSPFFGFTDGELLEIRAGSEKGLMFDALAKGEYGQTLKEKTGGFMEKLQKYRGILPHTPLHEFIRLIINDDYTLMAMTEENSSMENLELLIKKAADFEKTSFRGLFRFLRYIEKMKKYDLDPGEAFKGDAVNAVRIMSIHKSKGLEFPVVFLSNTNKKFNNMDISENIVIHRETGLGINIADQKRKLLIKTILKNAAAERIKLDNIGEEMRILYVGLTRAKEKLIITGAVNDREKTEGKYVSPGDAGSFLDFLLSALNSERGHEVRACADLGFVDASGLIFKRTEEAAGLLTDREYIISGREMSESEESAEIRREMSFKYPYQEAVNTPSKVSVSELKRIAMDKAMEEETEVRDITLLLSEESEEEKKERERELKERMAEASRRGSAFHKAVSMLPSGLKAELPAAGDFLDSLEKEGSLNSEERELIDPSDIVYFLRTGLYRRMSEALIRGELFREQPFIVGRRADEVFPGAPEDETVQIQGIIDAFFMEDGKITVMDYKTDRVGKESTLVKRYRKQLILYSEALEQILKQPVKEMLIYSVCLRKEIRVK